MLSSTYQCPSFYEVSKSAPALANHPFALHSGSAWREDRCQEAPPAFSDLDESCIWWSGLPSGYLTVCHGIDGPFIDGLPINSMVIFHGYVSHNQMVIIIHGHGPEMLGYLGIIWDNHIYPESRLMFSWMTSQTHEGKQQHRRLSRSFLLQETLEP